MSHDGIPAIIHQAITVQHAQEDALRGIALAALEARGRVRGGYLGNDAGLDLLLEVERQLSALIAVGAVPAPPEPGRRPLTS